MNRAALAVSGTAVAVALGLAGCAVVNSVTEVGTSVGVAAGVLTTQQGQSINKSVEVVGKTFESITPEQEYYIGRTVAATLLSTTAPDKDQTANDYVNRVGQSLALFSDRPETFGGYHFLVLDSDDINAFAAPGGLILVTRGLLRCCRNEDQVAAVLAHEIGHVELKHGLQAISKSRVTSALTTLAAESAKSLGGENLAELTKTFEGSISDITGTLVNSGYSRRFEAKADEAAVTILKRAGYDPHGLVGMLTEMQKRLKPGGHDFAKTHPDPQDRIKSVASLIGAGRPAPAPAARQARFARGLAGM